MKQKPSPAVVLPFVALPLLGLILSQSAPMVFAQGGSATSKTAKTARPKSKAQSVVAAKTAFPTIAATSPLVQQAFSATNLAGAKKLVGKSTPVTGTVTKVFVSKSNKVVLLNFAKDYTKALVAAVKSEDFSKFPDLTKLEGKKVLLEGKIVLYKGTPEIELTQAGSIKLIK